MKVYCAIRLASSCLILFGVSVMLINLLVDLSYGLLDPRVRHQ